MDAAGTVYIERLGNQALQLDYELEAGRSTVSVNNEFQYSSTLKSAAGLILCCFEFPDKIFGINDLPKGTHNARGIVGFSVALNERMKPLVSRNVLVISPNSGRLETVCLQASRPKADDSQSLSELNKITNPLLRLMLGSSGVSLNDIYMAIINHAREPNMTPERLQFLKDHYFENLESLGYVLMQRIEEVNGEKRKLVSVILDKTTQPTGGNDANDDVIDRLRSRGVL